MSTWCLHMSTRLAAQPPTHQVDDPISRPILETSWDQGLKERTEHLRCRKNRSRFGRKSHGRQAAGRRDPRDAVGVHNEATAQHWSAGNRDPAVICFGKPRTMEMDDFWVVGEMVPCSHVDGEFSMAMLDCSEVYVCAVSIYIYIYTYI